MEIVDFGESMLVNKMPAPFLRSRALLLTPFNEAAISLLTSGLKLLPKRIVVLMNVEGQKMGGRKVLAARGASIQMVFRVMDLKRVDGREIHSMAVGRH